jgi:hypothetical protein
MVVRSLLSRTGLRAGLVMSVPAAAVLAAAVLPARAIVVYSEVGGTPTATQNTTAAPNGVGTFVGSYNNAGAVLVAPDVILTTLHVADPTNTAQFVLNGHGYSTDFSEQIGNSQLVLMHLTSSTGSSGVPLYTSNPHTAQSALLVGYGGAAGAAYNGNSATPHGWDWSFPTTTQNWGATTTAANPFADALGNTYLGFAFQAVNGSSIYTSGDSGGGLFVDDGGTWKLAGIAYSVDAYYLNSTDNPNDPANVVKALYDVPGAQVFIPDDSNNLVQATGPQLGYASQIAPSAAALTSEINRISTVPEPTTLSVLGAGIGALVGARRRKGRA